jgi:hypothetical protein
MHAPAPSLRSSGRIEPPPCAREVLHALYPTLAWRHVSFHLGIPTALLPFTRVAITLPAPLGVRAVRVHVAHDQWAPCTTPGLGLLVHEAFHVLQFQQRLRGMGVGVLRAFTLQYLAFAAVQGGARGNRYEEPAYAQEDAFRAACAALGQELCVQRGDHCAASPELLTELLRRWPTLVRREA